uniref:Pyrin domain-containing protein n=1 Tax=Varanus komodoensis TaxID=61221 RepID=A0A8D2IJG3_VARKO
MKKNVRQTLCDALEDLLEQQFKALKGSLPATDEGREVPRGQLERADRQDVVDLMCCYYGEEGAPGVCIRVLEKINARDVAVKLREALWRHLA